MHINIVIRAALFSVALFAWNVNASAAPSIERVGPALSHPWGMDFLDHDTVLVTERDGRLIRIDLADGKASQITGVPRVYARRQGGLLDVAVTGGHVYLCYAAVLDSGGRDDPALRGNSTWQKHITCVRRGPRGLRVPRSARHTLRVC